jgi:hypothetical protein
MSKHPRPRYTSKSSVQTLGEGLEEYYEFHPHLTNPKELPPEFAKILMAHDASHIIYGCDIGMYDELKLLPLTWWTSDYKFRDHLRALKDPTIGPAVKRMYDDMVKQHGLLWLYGSIFFVLPPLLPELIKMWFKNHKRQRFVPFLNFEPLLARPLLEIRQEFDLLSFIK